MAKNKSWAEFLLRKMHDLELERGERITVTAFADYLGESQQTMSRWLAGHTPDPLKYEILGARLGPEFYELFDTPKPDPLLTYIKKHWGDIPPQTQQELVKMVEEYLGGKQEPKHRGRPQPNRQP